jgi:hypothetical protein
VPLSKLHEVQNFANDEFFVTEDDINKKFSNHLPLRLIFLSNHLPGKEHIELLAALAQLPSRYYHHLIVDIAGGFNSEEGEFF